ncbi:MAG: FHA domain-containing protein [Solirubrobacteraceae bacterium]
MADVPAAAAPIEAQRLVLLLPDGSRVPIGGSLTIGRGEQANIRIADQTVSRVHARISLSPDGPVIEDAGSRFGTMLSGNAVDGPTRLYPGAQIRVGDVVIGVAAEEPAPARMDVPSVEPVSELDAGPGETIVVPVDATLMGLRAAPNPALSLDGRLRPRVRSGWALKRLAADEGEERFVLRDLEGGSFVRMDADDAALFKLLDGNRTVAELLSEAERLVGPTGPGRLARLIADLADRGLLDGVGAAPAAVEPESALARILKPRDKTVTWVGDYFERAYHHWGRVFFSPLSVTFLALFALAGFGAFAYIVGARFGTPFVVANRLAIGGAVFVAGRFALVAVHELAHGLALAHYGRRASRGGLRLVLIFPYAFVDTSEAYFESRAHRIVISAAGPACDLTLGGLFSFACWVAPRGSISDVFFQLAFGAYVGAFFNLNPFLDRDGYQILVDFLREPGLRQRARQQFAQKLSGAAPEEETSPVLARYALAGVIWSAIGAGIAILFAAHYYHHIPAQIPHGLVVAIFIAFCVLLFIPVVVQLGAPLVRRARFGPSEVNRVIR